jgi:hypothetical protein
MLRTIELDDELPLKANEVDDVRPDRGLSSKLVAINLPSSKKPPEFALRAAGEIAQSTSEIALFAASGTWVAL